MVALPGEGRVWVWDFRFELSPFPRLKFGVGFYETPYDGLHDLMLWTSGDVTATGVPASVQSCHEAWEWASRTPLTVVPG